MSILLDNIFRGSFTVLPPEVRSGDTPGIAVKLLYSPAVEKAMSDAKDWDSWLDDVVEIFKFGYGLEVGKSFEYQSLNVAGKIIPYIHQNDSETTAIINSSLLAGSLSSETASELHPYAQYDEVNRVNQEKRAELNAQITEEGMNEYNLAEKSIAEL